MENVSKGCLKYSIKWLTFGFRKARQVQNDWNVLENLTDCKNPIWSLQCLCLFDAMLQQTP